MEGKQPVKDAMAPPLVLGLKGRFDHWRHQNPKTEAVTFFCGGFCFDLLMLHRIDSAPMLIHQGSYLAFLAVLLVVDHRITLNESRTIAFVKQGGFLERLIELRHGLIHFLFGTLLNAFIVFYFRAASGIWALLFLVLLGAILIANELPRFRSLGPLMRYALYSFALTSYFAYLFPTVSGQLDPLLFYAAVGLSSLVTLGLWWVGQRVSGDSTWSFQKGALPGLIVQVVLLLFYVADVVPPVPLSLRTIEIAHQVEWQGARVRIATETPRWKFWAQGDTTFRARKGDRIYVYARVFAPKGFRDALKVRWEFDGPKGWEQSDLIPLTITGGERDWRSYAYKQNYRPGHWRVTIETDEGRQVGAIRFKVLEDTSEDERTFREVWD
ncbi:MAG: DUF2914 domain-containing protein [Myxococcota bacterium]